MLPSDLSRFLQQSRPQACHCTRLNSGFQGPATGNRLVANAQQAAAAEPKKEERKYSFKAPRKLRRGERWDPQAHAAQLKERSLALQQLRKTKEEKRQKRSGLSEPAASSAEPPQQDVSGDMGPQRSLFKHRAPQRQHHTINTRKRWPPGQAQQSSEQPAVDDSHVSRRRTHAPLRHRETVSDRTARAFPDSLRSTPSSLPPLVMGPEEVSTTGRAGQGTQPQHRLQAAQAAPAAAPGNVYAELQQDRRSARQSGDAPDQLDWDPPGVVQEQQASSLPDLELPVPIRREGASGPTATFFTSESFEEAGANADMVAALGAIGIQRPSFIQAAALKAFERGAPHMVLADHAGSGKTLAYLIPLVQHLRRLEAERGCRLSRPRRPSLLLILPTIELCVQVLRVARALAKGGAPFRSINITGGYKKKVQRDTLLEGPDMVIGTPGRLVEFLREGHLQLDDCQAVVMDEVDVLLSDASLFHEQVAPLREAAPASTRFVLVTASLPEQTWLYLQQQFPGVQPVLGPGLHRPAPGSLEQLIDCSGGEEINEETGYARKAVALLAVLKDQGAARTIVFCNKINTCRMVENTLKRQLKEAVTIYPYHSAIDEGQRVRNLQMFLREPKDDTSMILVCTDRASRGMDTAAVKHVVMFDFPRDPSEYVRRAGRTARGAGGQGVVSMLVLGRQVQLAKHILERNEKGLPLHRVPMGGAC